MTRTAGSVFCAKRRRPRESPTPISAASTTSARSDGRPFLVMELLEGESISERLTRGPMPLAEALPVMLSILSALAALHRSSIVHRDLKPSNVFLSTQGVKLLDFGLAKPVSPLSDDGRTQTGRPDRAWSDRRNAAILRRQSK